MSYYVFTKIVISGSCFLVAGELLSKTSMHLQLKYRVHLVLKFSLVLDRDKGTSSDNEKT